MSSAHHARWSAVLAAACACGLAVACVPARAFAYNYASPLAHGCHEAITIAALRALRDELRATPEGAGLRELSMGMSADFEVAIEEGATIIRVGTAIFGARRPNG